MKLACGARVLVRDEEWLVNRVDSANVGGTAVWVTGVSETVRGMESIFLTALDKVTALEPETTKLVADTSPRFRRSRLYIEALLRRTPPSDARLYVGHKAAINTMDYQLLPAARALQQLRPRMLIADSVGLGKTIEVGILLSELIRRGRGERILVVALKSILAQFQEELWSRFAIPLTRLDSVGIERVRASIPANQNPFYIFNKVIISIDTLKKDEKYRRYLENCRWDVIVVDECQHVAERSKTTVRMSQRARLARLLASTSDALILTSATPHDGRPESFASLMNLLEPTAVANPSSYTRDEVDGLFVRRFKKDVAPELAEQFPERVIHPCRLPANPAEEAVLEGLDRLAYAEPLFRVGLLKAFLSSPAACLQTLEQRLKKAPTDELRKLKGLLEKVREFSKWEFLHEFLKGLGGERVVIFSERLETLSYLQKQIEKHLKLPTGVFYGSLDDQKQMELVQQFSQAVGPIQVLLASDAASEGINMHENCCRMVHFDIPWSLITLEQRNGRIDRYGQKRQPQIHYLLTVPQSERLRGDLRILDRLIEKENEAHRNLGDVAWLMKLHEPEKEEQRIGQAIASRERPEDVIPDEPELEEDDFLARLLAAANEPTQAEEELRREPLTLWAGEGLDYFRTGFEQLNDDLKDRGQLPVEVEWFDHLPQCLAVEPPPDLRRRYDYLAREIAPSSGDKRIRLTADRDYLLAERAKARRVGKWPTWQLFWDSHPVGHWLTDRVLSLFSRHEAPVLTVRQGVGDGHTAYLFQGIFSNQRSQPVLVAWPVVVLGRRGERVEELMLEEFAARVGLDQELVNPGKAADLKPAGAFLPQAVMRARELLKGLRTQRGDELRQRLKDEERKLRDWAAKKKAELDRRPPSKMLEREREDLERVEKDRREYLRKSLTTEPDPYLRVVAVFLPG